MTLLSLSIFSSCAKKYTCSCASYNSTCVGCTSGSESLTSTKASLNTYSYSAKNSTKALEACKNDHALDKQTGNNGLNSFMVICQIK